MKNTIQLTPWQKRQATLLYHFSSLNYLKEMQFSLNALVTYTDRILDLAKNQGRDEFLASQQWGERYTAENWANSAWPFLKDFQLTTARQIAERTVEKFSITGENQFSRGISEFSMDWASPEEITDFDILRKNISEHSRYIDLILNKNSKGSRINDYHFVHAWTQYKHLYPKIPRLQVRTDILVETGKVPPRTGAYISVDDPDAALQFAWTGGGYGKILPGNTFNRLGLDALHTVGRDDLWVNKEKMLAFVLANKDDVLLKEDSFYSISKTAELAPSLVARNAFTTTSSNWHYVELISGEYDEQIILSETHRNGTVRVAAGETCPQTGNYFTPARPDSLTQFKIGDIMPNFESEYGLTIWQLHEKE